MESLLKMSKHELLNLLWKEGSEIKRLIDTSKTLENLRWRMFDYLNTRENSYFDSGSSNSQIHILERCNAKECVRVLKNMLRSENEKLTGFSTLELLMELARGNKRAIQKASKGFLCEFIHLFKGIHAKSGIMNRPEIDFLSKKGREAGIERSNQLDIYAARMRVFMSRYRTGTQKPLISRAEKMKEKILKHFGGTPKNWQDYKWHLKHIIKNKRTLLTLVNLNKDELAGLESARANQIPFNITPYYLTLFNPEGRCDDDKGVRAHVLPSTYYCDEVGKKKRKGTDNLDLDFMGEHSTSPIDGITRRYAEILIIKPCDFCPQICVYCQRNWELEELENGHRSKKTTQKALNWIADNRYIYEVLITGGDPLVLDNNYMDWIIGELAKLDHIKRIRIGTRVLVTLPMRINEEFLQILNKYHQLGKRQIDIVTHFEYPAEITPASQEAIAKIKKSGINIYNQEVFTFFTSFKFQTAFLRKMLKLNGVDPYYTFNTKGKEETFDFRVPMARLLQERKEEARFQPGIERTDEPVYNVPKLGKSHLRSWQDHEPIMILPNGSRVYRFLPWEKNICLTHDYLYTDVPIYEYMERLYRQGENVENYKSIWYYF